MVQLQQQAEGKSPAAIKLREEISHVQKRKAMHAKSLDKVKGTLAPAPTLTLTLTLNPNPIPNPHPHQVKGTYAATQKEVAQLESEHLTLTLAHTP